MEHPTTSRRIGKVYPVGKPMLLDVRCFERAKSMAKCRVLPSNCEREPAMKSGMLLFLKGTIFAIALFAAGLETCNAQQLDFSIDGGNSFGNSFDIGVGSSTDVEVYLSEIPPDALLSTEGLFGFGLLGDLDMAAPGEITAASINAEFDFVSSSNFNSVAIEWDAAVLANSIPTQSRVLLGNIQFDSSGAGVSMFTFGDRLPGTGTANASWLTGIGTELDELVFGTGATNTYSLALKAVPEPVALPLILISAMALGVRRKRIDGTQRIS